MCVCKYACIPVYDGSSRVAAHLCHLYHDEAKEYTALSGGDGVADVDDNDCDGGEGTLWWVYFMVELFKHH